MLLVETKAVTLSCKAWGERLQESEKSLLEQTALHPFVDTESGGKYVHICHMVYIHTPYILKQL